MSTHDPQGIERHPWLADPRAASRPLHGLAILCAALLIAEIFVPGHGTVAAGFGLYALGGLVGVLAFVVAARALRRAVTRREDYYDG